MNIHPPLDVSRFEQLEPGDLFVFEQRGLSMLAMKTGTPSTGDRSNIALLGPEFPEGISEAYLLPWQPTTVMSFGKEFTVALPTEPRAWIFGGSTRDPVGVAVCGDKTYLCVHGGPSPSHFFQCYVEFGTGAIIEGRLTGSVAYTSQWEIGLTGPGQMWRSIVKYPVRRTSSTSDI